MAGACGHAVATGPPWAGPATEITGADGRGRYASTPIDGACSRSDRGSAARVPKSHRAVLGSCESAPRDWSSSTRNRYRATLFSSRCGRRGCVRHTRRVRHCWSGWVPSRRDRGGGTTRVVRSSLPCCAKADLARGGCSSTPRTRLRRRCQPMRSRRHASWTPCPLRMRFRRSRHRRDRRRARGRLSPPSSESSR